jgi:hypothetical protein
MFLGLEGRSGVCFSGVALHQTFCGFNLISDPSRQHSATEVVAEEIFR